MRWGWLLWWVVWAVFALPWAGLGTTPQWQRIEWQPFYFMRPRDWLLNVMFFVPFGLLAAYVEWSFRRVVATAAVISLLVEVVQVFAKGRSPSTTDVITNVAGAMVGLFVATHFLGQDGPTNDNLPS